MIVGIELSDGTLRAVRMEHFRPGRAPESIADIAYTPAVPGGVPPAEAISALMRQVGAENATVAVAVPSSWCIYREVSFPYRAARRVESTLTYALEGRLPGKVEGYVIEPLTDIHPAGAAGAHLLVAACPRERLKDLLAEFRSAGVDPCIVQPAVASLARVLPGGEETLLVRLAGIELEVAFLRDGEVLACEVIQMGRAAEPCDSPTRACLPAKCARPSAPMRSAMERVPSGAPHCLRPRASARRCRRNCNPRWNFRRRRPATWRTTRGIRRRWERRRRPRSASTWR